MKTWKNRRHHSKPSRKTRSRRQRGGAGVPYNAQALITKRNALDSKEKLGEALSDIDKQLLTLLTRIILNNQKNDRGDIIVNTQDSTLLGRFGIEQNTVEFDPLNPMYKTPAQRAEEAAALASQNADAARPGLLAQAEKFRAANAARTAARTSGLTVRGVPAPPPAPEALPPAPAPEALLPAPAAPVARPPRPAVAPGDGSAVYSMTGPAGENRTVSKCEETLAALRKELAGLQSKISIDAAEREGAEAELNRQIGELIENRDAFEAKAKERREALKALKASSAADAAAAAAALDAARSEAAGLSASQLAEIDSLRKDIAGKERLTADQQKRLAELEGQLAAAADAADAGARDAASQIARLQAAHAADLARLRGEYEGKLTGLTGDLTAARASLAQETGPKKKELTDEITRLQTQVDLQKDEIAKLGASLKESGDALEKTVADATAAGSAADAAAAKAARDADAAAAQLGQLSAANASLTDQLAAAKSAEAAAREAADAAGKSSDEANAAAAAARSAQELAESAAAAARAEAERANAARGTSEADKARLAREAEAAAAAAEASRGRADAAAASAAAKAAESADALARLGAAEAGLRMINESVPLIIQIVGPGGDGDKVGDGGRPTQLGERLRVTWRPGANVPLAWVFVLFRDGKPEYTQLLTEDDVAGFAFESTVAGDISATIFDVVMHSADQLLGR